MTALLERVWYNSKRLGSRSLEQEEVAQVRTRAAVRERLMVNSRGLNGAASAAIGGIQRAHQKLDKAAADVARSGLRGAEAVRVSFSDEAQRLAAGDRAGEGQDSAQPEAGAGGAPPTSDLAEALVNSNIAKHEQTANIKVLQTVDEMSEGLLDILE